MDVGDIDLFGRPFRPDDLDSLQLRSSAGFEAAERNGGFGGIKMTGDPLPQCQFRVEPAFEGDGPAHTCLNPSFFDINDPAELDHRTGLRLAG